MATLTKRFVDQASVGEYPDDKVPGFLLRVLQSGLKQFCIRYRLPGGRRGRYQLGNYGQLTVEQARDLARSKLFIVSQGRDPSAEKAEARKAWTVKQLAEHYEVEHLRKLRPATRDNYKRYLDRHIVPSLGKKLVTEVAPADVLRMFRDAERKATKLDTDGNVLNAGTTTANRVLATASGLFGEAIAQGLRADNPCATVKRNHENKRERYLTVEESARLLGACDRSPHTHVANFMRLLVFTGARAGETLSAPWSQFDLANGIWTKPSHHTKQKSLHSVPLIPAALELLTDMYRANEADAQSPWLFPSSDPSKHIADPKRAVATIFKAAGLTVGVSLHTLRHSFATQAVTAGANLHLVGKALGHTQAATTHRYAHAEHDPLRQMGASVDAELRRAREQLRQEEAAKATTSAEVVNLSKYRAGK